MKVMRKAARIFQLREENENQKIEINRTDIHVPIRATKY